MSGRQAKIRRKLGRKQLTKEFGKDYALNLTSHVIDTWEANINKAPLKLRLSIALKILRGKL